MESNNEDSIELDPENPSVDNNTVDNNSVENNNAVRVRQNRIHGYKRALRCEILWLGVVNLALIWSLIWDSKSECPDSHLKSWIYVMIPIQFIMIIPSTILQVYLPQLYTEQRRRLNGASFLYLISRLLNIVWVGWAITGIVWTFQEGSCAGSIPVVYVMCYIVSVMNSLFIGFPLLICCCTVPVTISIYLCCPSVFGIKKIRKASPRLIKSVTTSKKFDETIGVPKEDANCAICLTEYNNGEEIRFLNCGHHFHSDCIMEWLVKNMTCPFCKKEIDKKDEPVQKKPSDSDEPSNSDTTSLLV